MRVPSELFVSCVLVSKPDSELMTNSGEVFQDIEFSSGTGLPVMVATGAVQFEFFTVQIAFQGVGAGLLIGK